MKAIILAAGKGTRFEEITKRIPKSMIPVAGKPIIEHTLEALPSSVKEVFLIIGHLGDQIKKHLGKEYGGLEIKYIRLKNLTGTATAVWQAKKHIGKREKFLVLYGDDMYSKQELEKLIPPSTTLKTSWAFGLAKVIPPSSKYLNTVLDPKNYIIQALYPTEKEMKTGILISTGAYVMDGRIFKYKPVKLTNGEYGLPQTILLAAKQIPIKGIIMKNWLQINRPEDIKKAEIKIK